MLVDLGRDHLAVVNPVIVHLNRRIDHVTTNLVRVNLHISDLCRSNSAWQRIRRRSGSGSGDVNGSGPGLGSIATRLLSSIWSSSSSVSVSVSFSSSSSSSVSVSVSSSSSFSFSVSTSWVPGALRLEDFAFWSATRSWIWLISFATFYLFSLVLPLKNFSFLVGTSFLVLLSSGIVAFVGSVFAEGTTWSDSQGSDFLGSGWALVAAVPLSALLDRSEALD